MANQSKIKTCSVEDCDRVVRKGGKCYKHHGVKKLNRKKICSVEDCNQQVRKGDKCPKHSGVTKPLCKIEGCSNQVRLKGVCVKHGAKGRAICKIEGCPNQVSSKGVCIKHGGKGKPMCKIEGCPNHVQTNGVCIKHGAKVTLCSVKGCTNRRQTKGLCFKHGAKATLCSVEGCTEQAHRIGVCGKHGARLCTLCNFYNYAKRKVVAENKYVYMCAGCFYHTFPNEKVPRRYLKKQNYIDKELKITFGDDFFIKDKIIECGCSKKRPDWFRDCHKFCIIVECDEDQHKKSDTICENKRTMSIFQDLANRPLVIIRFNPDKYKTETGVIKGCFKFNDSNNIYCVTSEFKKRYTKLKETIQYFLDNEPTKEIETITLFYDN